MNPSTATLTTIAHQLIENRTAENFQFWIVYGVLALVLAAVVAVTTAYCLERGKLRAATDTLTARLDELRLSTAASEQVKTSIAHSDWTVKEFKTLRRIKLELLMAAAYKVLLASEVDAEFKLDQTNYEITSRQFMIELHQLSALYFAEFSAETDALTEANRRLAEWFINSRSAQRQLDLTLKHEKEKLHVVRNAPGMVVNYLTANAQQAIYDEAHKKFMTAKLDYAEEFPKLYWPLRQSVDALQSRATILMNELIAPTLP